MVTCTLCSIVCRYRLSDTLPLSFLFFLYFFSPAISFRSIPPVSLPGSVLAVPRHCWVLCPCHPFLLAPLCSPRSLVGFLAQSRLLSARLVPGRMGFEGDLMASISITLTSWLIFVCGGGVRIIAYYCVWAWIKSNTFHLRVQVRKQASLAAFVLGNVDASWI